MSKQDSLAFLAEWPPLDVGPSRLRTRAYERPDGMRYLYGAPSFDTTRPPSAFGPTSRIAYRTQEGSALFLGIFISREDRGQRLGEKLITHFIKNVEHTDGHFIGTGAIHKPIIALSLGRVGLEPVSDDFLVEILPRAASDTSDVPKVEILKNELPEDSIIDKSGSNQFYEAVPPDVAARYPINGPGMIVALHTPYMSSPAG